MSIGRVKSLNALWWLVPSLALVALVSVDGRVRPPLTRTVVRLDASYFSRNRGLVRFPVDEIGREAREVIAGGQVVMEAYHVVEGGERPLRVPITLPPEADGIPESWFSVSIRRFPAPAARTAPVQPEVGSPPAGLQSRFIRLENGWRLVRDPDDPRTATVEIFDPPPEAVPLLNLRLEGSLPTPRRLESRSFEVPPGARIEIGYGIDHRKHAGPGTPVTLRATLSCRGAQRRSLCRITHDVDDPAAAGWHDVSSPAGPGAKHCRLALSVRQPEAGAVRTLWAVPRVVTPVGEGEPFESRSLVLISLDTLRADHLSGYGYHRATSPEIDRLLMDQGTAFMDISTPFPRTDFAHLSLFTGLYPSAHPGGGANLPAGIAIRTLAEHLRDAGLETGGITENVLVGGWRGFWFGFDEYTEHPPFSVRDVFTAGVRYLEERRDRRFFLFLHTYQVHSPYPSSPKYEGLFQSDGALAEAGVKDWVPPKHRPSRDAYDRAIRETDDMVAHFLAALERLGLDRRTYVVLLSDHGEAFGEHGVVEHGWSVYQEEVAVPFIIRGPGVPAGRRIRGPASLVDVTPTILEILGLPPPERSQGQSLYGALRTGAGLPERPVYFERFRQRRGVRFGRWKFLEGARDGAVYDLSQDPQERKPVMDGDELRDRAHGLLGAYAADCERWVTRLESGGTSGEEVPVVPAHVEDALRALGYAE